MAIEAADLEGFNRHRNNNNLPYSVLVADVGSRRERGPWYQRGPIGRPEYL